METSTAGIMVSRLAALAQAQRLAAFRALVTAGPSGLSAGSLADRLAIPASTLSFHLTQLVQAGLINRTRTGRSLIYTADFVEMRSLIDFLADDCCGGNDCEVKQDGERRKDAA